MSNKFGKYIGNEIKYIQQYLDTETLENKNYPWVQNFEQKFIELSNSDMQLQLILLLLGFMQH